MYGRKKKERIVCSVDGKILRQQYLNRKERFENTIYNLMVGPKTYKVLPRQPAIHPVFPPVKLLSVRFLKYRPGKTKFPLPVKVVGDDESLAVKRGALVLPIARRVPCVGLEGLGYNLPDHIEVDVSNIKVGQKVRLGDPVVKVPKDIKPLVGDDFLLYTVHGPGRTTIFDEDIAGTGTAEGE
eukprot:CAMPEP_0113944292 /NCGR_PEP_ID=MMETSP1339-20121228/32796_1 /TAXON_ID=94617 /ORGANISM="Fibrocapsa japonica" /LENGTH=182 /DNA_ID=CAMNT_0000949449 /DNA_START=284 /DNA_END=832 /DNA_ORIENTATION=+ /assembly_acc=CAM_ASM_000762